MYIDVKLLLPVAAMVSAVLLFFSGRRRVFEVLGLIASGVWLAIAIGVLRWPLPQVPQRLVLGATLLVAGVAAYLTTHDKREVTASTVLAILGGVLVAGSAG